MYHFIVKQRVKAIFEHLNRGDFGYVLRQFSHRAEHWFSGHHALAGVRRTEALRAKWYERLSSVFSGIQFEIRQMVVSGWPWRTRVAIEWRDRVFDTKGVELLPNQGMFMITLRWGKAVEFHVYCDTQALAKNLEVVAAQGSSQAALEPLNEA